VKNFQEADWRQASRAFAVANTPLFLIRKLRQDPTVQEISKSFSGEDILSHLRDALARAPQTLAEYAIPYAYLVALALKPEARYINAALSLDVPPGWDWVDYIRRVLAATYSPTSQASIRIPGQLDAYPVSLRSDAPTVDKKLVLE
jgi:hypothetical protein